MFIIKYKKTFLGISILLMVASIVIISIFGFKLGIDFKGGAATEVAYTGARPEASAIEAAVAKLDIGSVLVQPTGDDGYLLKSRDLTEVEHQALLKAVTIDPKVKVEEKNYTSIGPSVGRELKQKAIWAIILVLAAIILFIAYVFRKVSRPVSSWKYGIITVITLVHNILIPTAVFSLLGHYQGAEIDTLFVIALLTVLGLSVHDTIVVFDRIRENLRGHANENFTEIVGKSTSQTFTRSVNTALTIIFTLFSLYFFGPDSTKNFSLVLVVGIFFGIYSSLCMASPLLVMAEKWQGDTNKKKKK